MASARLESLVAIEAAFWRELAAAPRDKTHAWRTAVLATTDGDLADARTVILREADPQTRCLRLFTDSRSRKAAQLRERPLGTLVLWSPALLWQLRLRVRLALHTDGLLATSAWARLKLSPSSQDYLSALPPGTPMEQALAARGERAHFGVIEAEVLAIDWLELHSQGHRRAAFDGDGARWLQP
jgi:pyridoxamine 5'-phosphate oxidase